MKNVLKSKCNAWGVIAGYKTCKTRVYDPDIDAIVIATHLECFVRGHGLWCARNSIFFEKKPLVSNKRGAKAIPYAANKAGIAHMPGYGFIRSQPAGLFGMSQNGEICDAVPA